MGKAKLSKQHAADGAQRISNSNLIIGTTIKGSNATGSFLYKNGAFKKIVMPNSNVPNVRKWSQLRQQLDHRILRLYGIYCDLQIVLFEDNGMVSFTCFLCSPIRLRSKVNILRIELEKFDYGPTLSEN